MSSRVKPELLNHQSDTIYEINLFKSIIKIINLYSTCIWFKNNLLSKIQLSLNNLIITQILM